MTHQSTTLDETAIAAQIENDRARNPRGWRTHHTADTQPATKPEPSPTPRRQDHYMPPRNITRCGAPHPEHADLACTLDEGHTVGYPTHKTTVPHPEVRSGNGHLDGDFCDIHAWDDNGVES